MPAVVQHMATLVDGIDIASGGEQRVALDTPMDPGLISFAGPGKSDADLSCAIAAGVVLNMESEARDGAHRAGRQAARHRAEGGGAGQSRFRTEVVRHEDGRRAEAVRRRRRSGAGDARARIGELGLDFYGFHIYSGSQNLKAASIQEAHEKTFALAIRLAADAPRPLRTLNIGGGFGIPYFPGEERLDLEAVGANLKRLLPDVLRALPGRAGRRSNWAATWWPRPASTSAA